jgi:hypothetical protein
MIAGISFTDFNVLTQFEGSGNLEAMYRTVAKRGAKDIQFGKT